eukprot:CAMPEP_0177681010 /NCGR_PEP_ID=MMETSP0447-20121125/30481_1 /TAXON_ID=0 /ORGANISM="Stygamoeba regulata, Strain BSH-02190019" /LENGTH=294 /DNA_ID=CAMNT_0019190385 /DNA_START=268 /DNA_END=1149 /DNA_ORIENTATION=-
MTDWTSYALSPRWFAVCAIAFAWAVGYFQWSLAWLILAVPIMSANAHLLLKRVRADQKYLTLWRVHHREWPTGETLHWLNTTIGKMWCSVVNTPYASGEATRKLNEVLAKVASNVPRLNSLKIVKLDFGDQPPLLSNVSVLGSTPNDEQTIVTDLIWNCNGSVLLTANSVITAHVSVSGLSLSAQVRVQLKYVSKPPFVGRVRIQTLDAAQITLKINPTVLPGRGSINVMEIPGLSGYLQELITVKLRNALVAPEFVEIDLEADKSAALVNARFTSQERKKRGGFLPSALGSFL